MRCPSLSVLDFSRLEAELEVEGIDTSEEPPEALYRASRATANGGGGGGGDADDIPSATRKMREIAPDGAPPPGLCLTSRACAYSRPKKNAPGRRLLDMTYTSRLYHPVIRVHVYSTHLRARSMRTLKRDGRARRLVLLSRPCAHPTHALADALSSP